MQQKHWGAVYLALAASIWGGMYVVSKVVLTVIPPFELVWIRYLIAVAALAIAVFASGQSWKLRRQDVPLIIGIGVIGYVISIWAQFAGTKFSTAQMGALLTSATPAFMVIFARFLLGEKVTWRKALSVILATGGVLLIVGVGDISRSSQLGGLILVVAALTWALMSVLVKRVPTDYSQLVVTTYAILTAVIVMLPMAIPQFFSLQLSELQRPTIWGGVLYLGIISTAGAFWLWNKGLQLVEAGSGGLYFFFQPLVGTVLGWLILGEQVGMSFWLGAFLILTGVLFVIRE